MKQILRKGGRAVLPILSPPAQPSRWGLAVRSPACRDRGSSTGPGFAQTDVHTRATVSLTAPRGPALPVCGQGSVCPSMQRLGSSDGRSRGAHGVPSRLMPRTGGACHSPLLRIGGCSWDPTGDAGCLPAQLGAHQPDSVPTTPPEWSRHGELAHHHHLAVPGPWSRRDTMEGAPLSRAGAALDHELT